MTDQKQEQPFEPPVFAGEAPASLNFFGITKAGWNVQFTLRDNDEDALMTRFARFVGILAQYQVQPKAVGQQPIQISGSPQPSAPQPPASNPPATPPPSTTQAASNSALSFHADTLAATLADGKTYWKIKGGRFSKWGINVWPEVLKSAGYDTDTLDVRQPVNMQGWTAYYTEDENGKPTKVTQLVRN